MINILIADDHPIYSSGIKGILEKEEQIQVLGEARDGEELLELLKRNPHTRLVILDIEMPKLNGKQVAKILRKDFPEVRILILSYHNESDYIYDFYQMGVHGYLLKDKGGSRLLGAIWSIMKSGNRPFPPMDKWGPPKEPKPDEDLQVALTSREMDVLDLSDLSSKEIAEQLNIDVKTVNHHRKNLRRKFDVDSTAKALRKAIKAGIIKA